MSTFVHPSLLWGLALVALPVLIHLINLLHHRRVVWAAMEFLLLSQKKHRTWIVLKQLLLLLLRIMAIAAVVLLAAQPLLHREWGTFLAGAKTHHIILLDDSFSMSDHWNDTSAFAEALQVVKRIGAEAARQTQPQLFTLLPFSHYRQRHGAAQNDLISSRVDLDFRDKLAQFMKIIEVSQSDAGPVEALRAVSEILGQADDQRRILYIISDFRARQWNDATELIKLLTEWQAAQGEKIHLINCIERVQTNLAINSLTWEDGIHAAGVPWFIEAAVTNFGKTAAKDVSITPSEDGHARPAIMIKEIPPGKTVKGRFQVNFAAPGSHQIAVRLESDAVDADNYRFFSVDLPDNVPVLLVDGATEARDARFLSWAAEPGGAARTGLKPQVESPRFLGLKPLADFRAIILANVERLDQSAVKALEQYVSAGGGAAFFLGELSQTKFYNEELYRDGKGIFPLPLKAPTELPIDRLETASDVQVDKHFIFRIFAENRESFLKTVMVRRYFAAPEDWKPAGDSGMRILARLRNGAPLVVEKSFGKGRAVAFLSTAAPAWNNWARNPTFVVLCQDLAAYLSQKTASEQSQVVGEPLELTLNAAKYQARARFATPRETEQPAAALQAAPDAEGKISFTFNDTDSSGIYEVWLTRNDNSSEIRLYAFNVNPAEGNLAALDKSQLAERLKGLKYDYEQASMFQSAAEETTGYNLSEFIIYALILLLIGEQILAWSASYHPGAPRALSASGGAR